MTSVTSNAWAACLTCNVPCLQMTDKLLPVSCLQGELIHGYEECVLWVVLYILESLPVRTKEIFKLLTNLFVVLKSQQVQLRSTRDTTTISTLRWHPTVNNPTLNQFKFLPILHVFQGSSRRKPSPQLVWIIVTNSAEEQFRRHDFHVSSSGFSAVQLSWVFLPSIAPRGSGSIDIPVNGIQRCSWMLRSWSSSATAGQSLLIVSQSYNLNFLWASHKVWRLHDS